MAAPTGVLHLKLITRRNQMDSVSRALLMAGGSASAAPPGQTVYEGPTNAASSTFSFVVPEGVTSISVVSVAPGTNGDPYSQGSAGNLAYGNNISVTPGETLTVVAGGGGQSGSQVVASRIARGGTNLVLANVLRNANSGTNLSGGGLGGYTPSNGNFSGFGGGGAGGYTGDGGAGRDGNQTGLAGAGGGAGAGGAGQVKGTTVGVTEYYLAGGGGGGGGVGLLGQGSSGSGGARGTGTSTSTATGGGPGEGGSSAPNGGGTGSSATPSSAGQGGGGGGYGGGGGGLAYSQGSQYDPGTGEPFIVSEYTDGRGPGGRGAVRIIWPGNTRQFPSTNTGNV